MKQALRNLGLLTAFMTIALGSGAQNATNSPSLVNFGDKNFGVRFSHTTNISTTYNPHGGADRVALSHRDKPIGGLLIRPAPPTASMEEFIESGKDYFRQSLGATSVDYDEYENPAKYKFHHLKADVKREDKDYVLERFIYLRDPNKAPEDEIQKVIWSMSGAFSFDFNYLKAEQEAIKKEIKTVIDTFKISGVSNSGTNSVAQPPK